MLISIGPIIHMGLYTERFCN